MTANISPIVIFMTVAFGDLDILPLIGKDLKLRFTDVLK